MSYNPTTWVEGVTPLGPVNLNKLEQGVQTAQQGVDTLRGASNQSVSQILALQLAIDTRSLVATAWNSSLKPTHFDVKDGATVVATIDLTYNADDQPTQMVVAAGGRTVTYTQDMTGGKFNSRTKAVV